MASSDPAVAEKKSVFQRLDELNEFERTPVTEDRLQSGRYFAGVFAGEHVAATEFVIGALFVMGGARMVDVILGLLLGNLLAVLSWTLVCAPIAVQTRLTLYWYLRRVAGPVVTVIYNLCNAVLYCILAGCMITVAASAVRIPFNIAPQSGWTPNDPWFVAVVIGVGTVVVLLAILGFKKLAQFATVCSPWMLLMFVAGALVALPQVGHVGNWAQFKRVADARIWTGPPPTFKTISIEGSRATIEFDNVENYLTVIDVEPALPDSPLPVIPGLGPQRVTAEGGEGDNQPAAQRPQRGALPVEGFSVSDKEDPGDGDFVPAEAQVQDRRVIVWAEGVAAPKVVRYDWPKTAEGVLCDARLVPVPKFVSSKPSQFQPLTLWHITFFAWICNLAMHLGLSDMAIFRYAKSSWYGLYSAFGMFLGHYVAWICAGIMGAAAVKLTQTPLAYLDSGEVAYSVLGWCGVIAVVIAGWTTSNPTLYRAGLALQVVTPNWPRWLVTLAAGAVTTAIACFPFVFRRLLDFVGIYGLLLVPVGAIVVVEHWIFPRLGWQRFWCSKQNRLVNWPALISWGVVLALAVVAVQLKWLHLFFLVIPVWFLTALLYLVLARLAGAARPLEEAVELPGTAPPPSAEDAAQQPAPATEEPTAEDTARRNRGRRYMWIFGVAALGCLAASLLFPVLVYLEYLRADDIKTNMAYIALVYFVTGTLYLRFRERYGK